MVLRLPSCVPVILVLWVLSLICTNRASGSTVGVAYGRIGDNLPPPSEVVRLLKSNNIDKVRIYDTNGEVLAAFQNSGISLIVGAPNEELSDLAATGASPWVQTNIVPYASSIKCIAVGNEVLTQATQYTQYLYPAMNNVYKALVAANLQSSILVSTSHAMDVIDSAHPYPPSAGTFSSGIQTQMSSILTFLSQTGAPFLADVYPYFSYISPGGQISLPYALFEPGTDNTDNGNGLHYTNLFDAQVDTLIAAMAAMGYSNIPVVVTESGWPSQGDARATVDNAHTYNSNLVGHVPKGTPKRPNVLLETYIFSLFNEDLKSSNTEQHFGVFNPDETKVYNFTF